MNVSPEELRKLLRYEPETGKLFWRYRPLNMFKDSRAHRSWNSQFSGKEAFTANCNGYLLGSIHNKRYKSHRVIWAIYHGEWPNNEIDHINGVKNDNKIFNLRDSTHAQNLKNRSISSKNTSGYKGVSWDKNKKKWISSITVDGTQKFLGYFTEREQAASSYRMAAERHFGEFARGE